MANPTTDIPGYWDRYAEGVSPPEPENESAPVLEWTQYSGHGPGADLLGEPAHALELGAGRGDAVAALASTGVKATGVDISPVQVDRARERWGHLGAEFLHEDAVAFLKASDQRWDAIYSVWGAVWFTDPDVLLPLVRERLDPGGRLVFSHAEPVPGSSGPQGMYGGGFNGHRVWLYQWAYEPEAWEETLTGHGFEDAKVWVEPAPKPEHVGTLIGVASR
jgi:SAM-dependent methyltransferase